MPTETGRKDDADDVENPAGLQEVHLDMGLMSIEEEEPLLARRYQVACMRFKGLLEPFEHDVAVNPSTVGVISQYMNPWECCSRPIPLYRRSRVDYRWRNGCGACTDAGDDGDMLAGSREGLAVAGMVHAGYLAPLTLECEVQAGSVHVIHAGGG